jgi:hypothetical protein
MREHNAVLRAKQSKDPGFRAREAARQRERYKTDPKYRALGATRQRERRRWKDPKHRDTQRARWLRRQFGIAVADYDNMLNVQNGACAICREPPADKSLAVDHCHDTGAIRGLLCSRHNLALGLFNDDPMLLLQAAHYLLDNQKLTA